MTRCRRPVRRLVALAGALVLTCAVVACSGDTPGRTTEAGDRPGDATATGATGDVGAADRAVLLDRLGGADPFRRATGDQRACLVDRLLRELGAARTLAVVDTVLAGEATGRAVTDAEAETAGDSLVACADYRALFTHADATGVGIEQYECQARHLEPGGFADIAATEFLDAQARARHPGQGRRYEADGACSDPATLRTNVARAATGSWPLGSDAARCYADRRVADVGAPIAARTESRHHRSTDEGRAMVDALAACAELRDVVESMLTKEVPPARAACLAGLLTDGELRAMTLAQLTDDVDPMTDARAAQLQRSCPTTGAGA